MQIDDIKDIRFALFVTVIEWSLCDESFKKLYDKIAPTTSLITDKDTNGFSVGKWKSDERSNNFTYGEL